MRRTFKYRVYANKHTIDNAVNWLNLCRILYNAALEQRIGTYRQNKRSLTRYDQDNELPSLKEYFPEYKNVGSHVLQNVIARLDDSYRLFYKRGGVP